MTTDNQPTIINIVNADGTTSPATVIFTRQYDDGDYLILTEGVWDTTEEGRDDLAHDRFVVATKNINGKTVYQNAVNINNAQECLSIHFLLESLWNGEWTTSDAPPKQSPDGEMWTIELDPGTIIAVNPLCTCQDPEDEFSFYAMFIAFFEDHVARQPIVYFFEVVDNGDPNAPLEFRPIDENDDALFSRIANAFPDGYPETDEEDDPDEEGGEPLYD